MKDVSLMFQYNIYCRHMSHWSAQGECLDQELELVSVLSFFFFHSVLFLFLLKRAGYCGYCSSHFIWLVQIYMHMYLKLVINNLSSCPFKEAVQVFSFTRPFCVVNGRVIDSGIYGIKVGLFKNIQMFGNESLSLSSLSFCCIDV